MFIFLFCILLNMKLVFSTIIVQKTGIYEIDQDDIAMIFYLEIENSCDHDVTISVKSLQCAEGPPDGSLDHMFLIGSQMGTLGSKEVKNFTLIYTNLFLLNRIGTCLVAVNYQSDAEILEVRQQIYFNSARRLKQSAPSGTNVNEITSCQYADQNGADECVPVDCTVKYSTMKSFFNKELMECQPVPECPPNAVYNPKSNNCRPLHRQVCESDLQLIEDGNSEQPHAITNMVATRCHHGTINNLTGKCQCDKGWITSTCAEKVYHPTLNLYHLCNVELNSWGRANQEKLLMTALVLLVIAMAIAVKMLLAACILTWCCRFFAKKKRKEYLICSSDDSSLCGDEECPEVEKKNKATRTGVSFSELTSEDEGNTTDSNKSVYSLKLDESSCRCCNKSS